MQPFVSMVGNQVEVLGLVAALDRICVALVAVVLLAGGIAALWRI